MQQDGTRFLPTLDPLPVADSVSKAQHTFEPKQRITFDHEGAVLSGTISHILNNGNLAVRVDGGKHVMIVDRNADHAVPEDFHPHASSGEHASAKATLTVEQINGLQRALGSGQLDAWDAYRTSDAIAKLSCMISLDGPETDCEKTLREMCVKLHLGASASTGDSLTKRARSKFHVGQTVIEKSISPRTGTVVDVMPSGLIEIRFSPSLSGLYCPDSVEAA